jgi:hypothetical protein
MHGEIPAEPSATRRTKTRLQTLSDRGHYEWTFRRRWADGPLLTFVGLNPSVIMVTPDVDADGPTVQRMQARAIREGFAWAENPEPVRPSQRQPDWPLDR